MQLDRLKQLGLLTLVSFLGLFLLFPMVTEAKGVDDKQYNNEKFDQSDHPSAKHKSEKSKHHNKKHKNDHKGKKPDHLKSKSKGKSNKANPHSKANKSELQNSSNNKHSIDTPTIIPLPDANSPNTPSKVAGLNKNPSKGNKQTEIHLHLKKCFKSVSSVAVEINGEMFDMSNPGNSPLYKLKDNGEFVKDDVLGFLLMTSEGKFYISVDDLRVGVEAQGTINYWLEDCPKVDEPDEPDGPDEPEEPNGPDEPDGPDEPGEPNGPDEPDGPDEPEQPDGPTTPEEPDEPNTPEEPDNPTPDCDKDDANSDQCPGEEDDEDVSVIVDDNDKPQQTDKDNQSYDGVLPKTGESSPIFYYIFGGLLASLGAFYLWMKRNRRFTD